MTALPIGQEENAPPDEHPLVTNDERERWNEVRSRLLSFVRHQISQPLTVIQGYSELIRDDQLSLAEIKEYAAVINREAAHLGDLINRMRDTEQAPEGAQPWQESW